MKNEIGQILSLVSKINVQHEQIKSDYEIGELGISLSDPVHRDYLAEIRKVSIVLPNYLQTLNDNDLSHLVTLMYTGRDSNEVIKIGGFNKFHQFIQSKNLVATRNICIDKITEKEMNLPTYYQEALALAYKLNFDVDIDFI